MYQIHFIMFCSLQVHESHPTGGCVCLILEDNRCCFANIGASLYFQQNVLDTEHGGIHGNLLQPANDSQETQIFYVEGFFLTKKLQICQYIFEKFCHNRPGKVFATNLSAEYIINEHPMEINYLAEASDILFGNRSEFKELAKVNGLASIDVLVSQLFEKQMGLQKIIVVTNGDKFVDFYVSEAGDVSSVFQHKRFDVIGVPKSDIVDTTGAGDSFVAGFFYAYIRKQAIDECIQYGIDTASKKIRAIGARLVV